ncbi:hypothetical protein M8C21_033873 [Ambrosia artemisiifolia]|uniref:asparagine--tRNA ligase n=1 Tax=Ambrosia artemisiifolia TaxID=4212 RepID=A0AAD5CD33_AMBAR|nr:hypothetical protein M8C21_033873 [Ambrosia artemisiifolia]
MSAAGAPPVDKLTISDTIPQSDFSQRVPIRTILTRPDGGAALSGQTLKVGGWVKKGREQGKGTFAFIELNDGSCPANLQLIIYADVAPLGQVVATGTCLHVEGVLQMPPEDKQGKQAIELKVVKVLEIGSVDSSKYPLPKTRLTLEFLRDYVHLRPRTNTVSSVETAGSNSKFRFQVPVHGLTGSIAAIARIRNTLAYATHTFFQKHGFLYVHTPIITTSDCEGAGEMFQVTTLINEAEKIEKELIKNPPPSQEDVDLAKSDVKGKGEIVAKLNVYTFGPTFRAENSHTSRHLAEFWMVEPEIAFADIEDDMKCAEAYVRFLCQWLLDNCLDDMEFMVEKFDKNAIKRLQMVSSTNFVRLSYTEAVTILEEAVSKGHKFENKVEWGIDLASEHEKYLTEVKFESPVIVYNYPKGIKSFYMKLNPDKKTVAAMDVLVPKVGELIGGSQREENYEVLKERILEMGLPLEPYEWYLDLRRYGTVKHSGFGLGFERMILFATGIDNIRDVIPFPRYPGRADL